ncbi:MAG TPA: hypothetical protein VGK23_09305 [Methanomassiliicoccales archaeon]|jgi:uncharacterized membrane protein YozB (DUF420 family)
MVSAPLASTFVALALIPVAFFFTHAFLSGRRGWRYHTISGTVAVAWDLSLSIFYMLYRTFGGQTDGSILTITPSMTSYFAVHGVISVIVMVLEIMMLITGYLMWKTKKPSGLHRSLTIPMIVLWFLAFLSGEIVYIVYYVL